jgi:hypothetical protein
MPIIDVSQNSYRSLVKAAHKRGMSIDRFIQATLNEESPKITPITPEVTPTRVANEASLPVPAAEQASPMRFTPANPASVPVREPAAQSVTNAINSSFDALWERIEKSAGTAISTKRGQDFTYKVESGYLTVNESGARIPRSQFKKALNQWPQSGPSNMRGIYAASVVWAVLADERILDSAA